MNHRLVVILLFAAAILAGILWYRDRVTLPHTQSGAGAEPDVPGLREHNLKILYFYAGSPVIPKGQKVPVCYGVVNASEASISPEVGTVRPLFNKCVEVSPQKSTVYTLTAKDSAGNTATKSIEITVGRPQIQAEAPAPRATGATIDRFELDVTKPIGRDGLATLCFDVSGATAVVVTPEGLARTSAQHGCFYVKLKEPTDYTLTAYSADGSFVTRTITVAPPAQ